MKIGNLDITVIKTNSGLRLHVAQQTYGIEGNVTPRDLQRLAVYLSPARENGVDLKLADEIVSAGLRVLARKSHPDAGGSNDKMKALNNAADSIKKRIGG